MQKYNKKMEEDEKLYETTFSVIVYERSLKSAKFLGTIEGSWTNYRPANAADEIVCFWCKIKINICRDIFHQNQMKIYVTIMRHILCVSFVNFLHFFSNSRQGKRHKDITWLAGIFCRRRKWIVFPETGTFLCYLKFGLCLRRHN